MGIRPRLFFKDIKQVLSPNQEKFQKFMEQAASLSFPEGREDQKDGSFKETSVIKLEVFQKKRSPLKITKVCPVTKIAEKRKTPPS